MISKNTRRLGIRVTTALAFLLMLVPSLAPAWGQEQAASDMTESAMSTPEPLSAEELEILVARVALYPDELIAVISGASLYPLQIVEAARFLDDHARNKDLKPKDSWDGSVISLLNYPEIVKMMSDDLDWTQTLADALAWQQKNVLIAVQQLREEAVAKGIIKTDEKLEVVKDSDNIVIKSAQPEVVYVPQYEPQMLYVENYAPAPVSYYPDPYPNYWAPTATFFAGAVTGAVWAAAVDWDDWGVWGGHWNGGDIDIECNHCIGHLDLDGKINIGDIDWKDVDLSKIKIDKDQFQRLDRTKIKNDIKLNSDNAVRKRAVELRKNEGVRHPGSKVKPADIRKSTLDGLKARPAETRPERLAQKPRDVVKRDARPTRDTVRPQAKKPTKIERPMVKPKPAAKIDNRPKKPSGLGNVDRGKISKVHSNRGRQAMGGGHRGGAHKAIKRPAGRRH